MNNVERSTLIQTGRNQRLTLTFSVEGLAAREELLFKGYVRLLDHLTEHHWQYCEPSASQRVDLLVADERIQPTRSLQAADKPQPVLRLGASKSASEAFFLSWPLRPYELENELNRLGRLLRGNAASSQVLGAQKPVAGSAQVAPVVQRYRLRQWPKPSLLTEPGSMRLATLLTGRAIGLEELVARSTLPQAVCEHFIVTMHSANLMVSPITDKPALIAPLESQGGQPAIKAIAQPGLLARIRMRLGIKA